MPPSKEVLQCLLEKPIKPYMEAAFPLNLVSESKNIPEYKLLSQFSKCDFSKSEFPRVCPQLSKILEQMLEQRACFVLMLLDDDSAAMSKRKQNALSQMKRRSHSDVGRPIWDATYSTPENNYAVVLLKRKTFKLLLDTSLAFLTGNMSVAAGEYRGFSSALLSFFKHSRDRYDIVPLLIPDTVCDYDSVEITRIQDNVMCLVEQSFAMYAEILRQPKIAEITMSRLHYAIEEIKRFFELRQPTQSLPMFRGQKQLSLAIKIFPPICFSMINCPDERRQSLKIEPEEFEVTITFTRAEEKNVESLKNYIINVVTEACPYICEFKNLKLFGNELELRDLFQASIQLGTLQTLKASVDMYLLRSSNSPDSDSSIKLLKELRAR